MNKFLKFIAGLLVIAGLVSAGFWVWLTFYADVKQGETTPMEGLFFACYILLAISIIAVIVSAMVGIAAKPQTIKKTVLSIIAFALVFIVSYFWAGGDMISTGLYAFYIFLVIAVLVTVLGPVMGMINTKR